MPPDDALVISFHLHHDQDHHDVALVRLTEDGETHDTWVELQPDEALLLDGLSETIRYRIIDGRAYIRTARQPPSSSQRPPAGHHREGENDRS